MKLILYVAIFIFINACEDEDNQLKDKLIETKFVRFMILTGIDP